MLDEVAQTGNKALAKFCGWSLRTTCRRIPAMKLAGAVWDELVGTPPRRVNRWFPSVVQRYLGTQQIKREKMRHSS